MVSVICFTWHIELLPDFQKPLFVHYQFGVNPCCLLFCLYIAPLESCCLLFFLLLPIQLQYLIMLPVVFFIHYSNSCSHDFYYYSCLITNVSLSCTAFYLPLNHYFFLFRSLCSGASPIFVSTHAAFCFVCMLPLQLEHLISCSHDDDYCICSRCSKMKVSCTLTDLTENDV